VQPRKRNNRHCVPGSKSVNSQKLKGGSGRSRNKADPRSPNSLQCSKTRPRQRATGNSLHQAREASVKESHYQHGNHYSKNRVRAQARTPDLRCDWPLGKGEKSRNLTGERSYKRLNIPTDRSKNPPLGWFGTKTSRPSPATATHLDGKKGRGATLGTPLSPPGG